MNYNGYIVLNISYLSTFQVIEVVMATYLIILDMP